MSKRGSEKDGDTRKRLKTDVLADYYDIYNNEVVRFMDPLVSNKDLADSYVHSESRVKWLQEESYFNRYMGSSDNDSSDERGEDEDEDEDDDDDDDDDDDEDEDGEKKHMEEGREEGKENHQLGTLWTRREKQLFFHNLSRHSIHTLNDWHTLIPSKSKFEIIAYYNVLKQNLIQLKQMKTKKHGCILPKQDFPIAYEMDEFFVNLEEEMSRRVNNENEKLRETYEGIINVENWYKRWPPIYSRHRIQEYQPACRIATPMSEVSLKYLEECVKRYTRKILWYTVLPSLEEKHLNVKALEDQNDLVKTLKRKLATEYTEDVEVSGKEQQDEVVIRTSNKELPHLVDKECVLRGLTVMKQEGHLVPTLAESVLSTLDKFELEHEEGKLFKSKKIAMGIIPALMTQRSYDSLAEYSRPEANNEAEEEPLHKRLYNMNNKHASKSPFVCDDPYDRLDNPLEAELCEIENDTLERKDTRESKHYQHTILAYLGRAYQEDLVTMEDACHEPSSQEPETSETPRIPAAILREFQYE